MSYWYYDDKDGYKKKQYDGDPVFVIHEEAEGKSRMVYASSDRARQHLYAMLENPPANLSSVTYAIETPGGEQLYIK